MIAKLKNPFSLWRRSIEFRFDNYSWIQMCELSGVEFDEMEKLNETQLVMSWMYGAYLSGCSNAYRKPKYNFNYIARVYRWYYVNNPKALEVLKDAMLKSKLLGKTVAEWGQVNEKKKVGLP